MENKLMTSVTKEVIKMFLIDKVLSAIKNVWPREEMGELIFIQQDNTRYQFVKMMQNFVKQQVNVDLTFTYLSTSKFS